MTQEEVWAALVKGKTIISGDKIFKFMNSRLHQKINKPEFSWIPSDECMKPIAVFSIFVPRIKYRIYTYKTPISGDVGVSIADDPDAKVSKYFVEWVGEWQNITIP